MPDNRQYDRVKEITDQLEAGIQDLFASEQYVTWLNTMSKFHDYSLNNTLLIAMQKPDATLVAGYTAWQKQFGRQVQKGEKAIRIIAPAPYKHKVEIEKIDPVTQQPVLDENGNPIREETEIRRMTFKVTSVFDVSQTEGRELPKLGVAELSGDVKDYDLFFEALKRTCPVPMEFEEIEGGAKGYYHQVEKRIALQKDMSQIQTIKTAIHEMTHQKLHAIDPDINISDMPKITRNGKEVEAESVAYTVCQHFGIDTSDYSFAYVAGWSHGKETPELKASLMTIRQAASELIDEIEGHVKELVQEKAAEAEKEDRSEDYPAIDQKTAIVAEGAEKKQTLTFYAAECMEFTDFGEFHETETLEEAIALYKQIPPDRMNGIPGIGFILYEDGIYDGSRFGMMQADKMQWDIVRMVPHFAENPVIREAMERCEELLADYDLIHGNPAFSQEQIDYLTELSHQDYNIQAFWVNGQPMDLTAQPLSAQEIAHIRYQVDVDAIPKMLFDNEQWRQIQSGIQQELNVRIYAKPDFSAQQMDMIKRALITESHGYITMDDVKKIADPAHSADEMKTMLRDVRKESMQRLSAAQEAKDAQAGLQENGHYRYYSTQRPVGPGTYPKEHAVGIENFDQRKPVDNGKMQAWGYVEYNRPLSGEQQRDYELRPAESYAAERTDAVYSGHPDNKEERIPEKVVSGAARGADVPKPTSQRKKSVLADLHAKQAMIAGTAVSGRMQNQTKEEPR